MPLPLNVPALNSNVMNRKRILAYTYATEGLSRSSCLIFIRTWHANHSTLLQKKNPSYFKMPRSEGLGCVDGHSMLSIGG